jgi:hypothetical protein
MPGQRDAAMRLVKTEIVDIRQWIFLRIDSAVFHRCGQVTYINCARVKAERAEDALMIFVRQRPELQAFTIVRCSDCLAAGDMAQTVVPVSEHGVSGCSGNFFLQPRLFAFFNVRRTTKFSFVGFGFARSL